MSRDPLFLTIDQVLELHELQIRLFGGTLGLRDRRLLESALAQPQATFAGEFLHPDLFEQAGAYLYHLVENHAFVDGNKRIGLMAALVFLRVNGVAIPKPPPPMFELVMSVASGQMKKPELTLELRRRFGAR